LLVCFVLLQTKTFFIKFFVLIYDIFLLPLTSASSPHLKSFKILFKVSLHIIFIFKCFWVRQYQILEYVWDQCPLFLLENQIRKQLRLPHPLDQVVDAELLLDLLLDLVLEELGLVGLLLPEEVRGEGVYLGLLTIHQRAKHLFVQLLLFPTQRLTHHFWLCRVRSINEVLLKFE